MIFSYAFAPPRFSSKHPPFEVCLDREWSREKRGPVAALPSDSSWRHMSGVHRSNLHNTPCKKQARHWGSGSVLDQDHGSAMLPHSHAFKSTPSLLRTDVNITCIRLRPLIQLALSRPSLRQFADPGLSPSLGRSTRPLYHIDRMHGHRDHQYIVQSSLRYCGIPASRELDLSKVLNSIGIRLFPSRQ